MKRYNGLNSCKVNLESVGICKLDGMRFTDPKCTHGTIEQIAHCKEIDERMDNDDIFGHPIQVENDAWLDTGIVKLPQSFNKVTDLSISERVAQAYGYSQLPHDAELDGCGNDPDLVTELRGGF